MVKCSYCNYEDNVLEFEPLREPWKFGFYIVRMLECLKCDGIFNYYSGVSPKGRKSEFMIMLGGRRL